MKTRDMIGSKYSYIHCSAVDFCPTSKTKKKDQLK